MFEIFPLRVLTEAELGVQEHQDMWVLSQVRIVGWNLVCYKEAVPIQSVFAMFFSCSLERDQCEDHTSPKWCLISLGAVLRSGG